ncbi:MAG: tRNA 2-thiouridine(34) synthase MnmA [Candidatus Eisenbacteria bacterium]
MSGPPRDDAPLVAVAMSGGVDSSVAAALLVEKGYRVFGVTMKLWCYAETAASPKSCCSLSSIDDAKAAAAKIGIAHYVMDLEEAFESQVVKPFCTEYAGARTPNPCVLCNSEIKFNLLMDRVVAMGADYFATGHYARIRQSPAGAFELVRAFDREKDQSYVLWGIERSRLPAILFPLGETSKDRVRERASKQGIAPAERRESQDVCFVEAGSCGDFVQRRLTEMGIRPTPGRVLDTSGRELAAHDGVFRFTIGQRRGLGVSSPGRKYVVRLDGETNAVVLGGKEDLLRRVFVCGSVNWLGKPPAKALVQIRYTHTPAAAGVEEEGNGRLRVFFDERQYSITPGQSSVFYEEDVVLGGGVIEKVLE